MRCTGKRRRPWQAERLPRNIAIPSDKAVAERIPYDLWHGQGHLHLSPGKTVSYEFVANYLRQVFRRYNVKKLAFDRWNFRHLVPWLLKAGFSEQLIKERFVEFGQGVASMSPALRDLEQVLLEGNLAHGGHPVLSMCEPYRDRLGRRR